MIKRVFDLFSALFALLLFSPLFILISLAIISDSRGGVFYKQRRIGRAGKLFFMYKFRSMHPNQFMDKLTVGKDSRITTTGSIIRKFKLDELPQLINIIKGEMSVVGPRPETPNYVSLYTDEQKKVLTVRPGLTDYASLKYINESALLAKYSNPQKAYVEQILPVKLKLNLKYIEERSFLLDLRIIFLTVFRIFR